MNGKWQLYKLPRKKWWRSKTRWKVVKWKNGKKKLVYGSNNWEDAFALLLAVAYKTTVTFSKVGFQNDKRIQTNPD